MKKIALLGSLAAMFMFAQQPKFEVADVHVSPTARGFAQNFGGVLRAGQYVNRDATMLQLIAAAYGVPQDDHYSALSDQTAAFFCALYQPAPRSAKSFVGRFVACPVFSAQAIAR